MIEAIVPQSSTMSRLLFVAATVIWLPVAVMLLPKHIPQDPVIGALPAFPVQMAFSVLLVTVMGIGLLMAVLLVSISTL